MQIGVPRCYSKASLVHGLKCASYLRALSTIREALSSVHKSHHERRHKELPSVRLNASIFPASDDSFKAVHLKFITIFVAVFVFYGLLL